MNKTGIEWVKNPDGSQGFTWNVITGCLNHTNGLCKGGGFPCYAYRLAHGRLRERYLANKNTAPLPIGINLLDVDIDSPFYPRFWPERLKEFSIIYGQNTARATPKGIFVCDMGELFGDWVPREWVEQIFERINGYPLHRFYFLTKQPRNLIKFNPFPPNCWVGVTVTNNGAMTLALTNLQNIRATVKYISFEPLLGSIGMSDHMSIKGIVDWVIIGGQTKPYKPPRWEWVSEIIDACVKAGVPYFLKDNLEKIVPRVSGGFILGKLRQELPDKGGERDGKTSNI